MENFLVKSIGKIRVTPENSWIQIKQAYFPALKQIDSFRYPRSKASENCRKIINKFLRSR